MKREMTKIAKKSEKYAPATNEPKIIFMEYSS